MSDVQPEIASKCVISCLSYSANTPTQNRSFKNFECFLFLINQLIHYFIHLLYSAKLFI